MNDTQRQPAPIVFSPAQAWDGNDGSWSTFILRIGTPEQTFRVLPSTSSQETLVPAVEGCTPDDPDSCGGSRGVYAFQGHPSNGFAYNKSTSWKMLGVYNLGLEEDLGYTGAGVYGLETVSLQLANSGGPTLQDQVIGGFATKDFYLGIFGLGTKPSNFSDLGGFDNPQPSVIKSLRDHNKIPSLSYGYTAGASYRTPKVLGSLTLGGYDASRFIARPNLAPFRFDSDDSNILSVGVRKITATSTPQGTVTLLGSPAFSVIDSTIPHLWLPEEACDEFEKIFGLSFDSDTGLYLINETMRSILIDASPSIVISLGNDDNPLNLTQITLPYAAFDVKASYPIYNEPTNYFPIRRASNSSQYKLGRTFLQESYLRVDHERAEFFVHQASFENPMPEQTIVAVHPLGDDPGNKTLSSTSTHSLSSQAIAGLAGGVVAVMLLLTSLAFLFFQRRKAKLKKSVSSEKNEDRWFPEMPVHMRHEMFHEPEEAMGSKMQFELQANEVALISDDAIRYELDGNVLKQNRMANEDSM